MQYGGLFSVALSLEFLPAAVNCLPALRSPDFPLLLLEAINSKTYLLILLHLVGDLQ